MQTRNLRPFESGNLSFMRTAQAPVSRCLPSIPWDLLLSHRLIPVWPAPPSGFGGMSHVLDRKECAQLIRALVDMVDPTYVIDPSNLLSDPDAPLSGGRRLKL